MSNIQLASLVLPPVANASVVGVWVVLVASHDVEGIVSSDGPCSDRVIPLLSLGDMVNCSFFGAANISTGISFCPVHVRLLRIDDVRQLRDYPLVQLQNTALPEEICRAEFEQGSCQQTAELHFDSAGTWIRTVKDVGRRPVF